MRTGKKMISIDLYLNSILALDIFSFLMIIHSGSNAGLHFPLSKNEKCGLRYKNYIRMLHKIYSELHFSLKDFPAEKEGVFDAGISISSPVFGLRPLRAAL